MSIINRIILLLFICLLYSCDNENMPFVLEYAKLGDATDITQTSVTLSAEVFPENSSFDEVYFVIEDSLKMFDAIKENCSMSTTGKYSINLKNLISGMTYSYYFVIKSFSSEKKKFTTLRDDNMPYIPDCKVVDTSMGTLVLSAISSESIRGFIVREEATAHEMLIYPDSFSSIDHTAMITVSGLKPDTQYSIRAFCLIQEQWDLRWNRKLFGNEIKFVMDTLGNFTFNK